VPTIIDSLFADTTDLLALLNAQENLSLASFANATLRKVLLVSAASWFEVRISLAVERFSLVHSNGHPGIQSIIKRKAIDRQYHTYFEWTKGKPGPFYSLFGEVCGNELKQLVNDNNELKNALTAFLELGNLRNELVHGSFATFPFEKTAEEVHALYLRAERFVAFLEEKLSDSAFGRPTD
jgi:hypothetical protein